MKKIALLSILLALCAVAMGQGINVLFVGNSYTEVNNLPQMIGRVAESMGDQMSYQSNTPGGCTFMQHCTNHSMEMICGGGWDIVVLQEQSQYPSFPQSQVEAEVFPYAQRLVDSVYTHNPCCEPMFYMTWGRKNGDSYNAQFFPVLGTYEGMDSMLCERYTYMAQQYDASLCPVGRVWRYLRENHPDIELYQSDGSHPSMEGSYAAACAFYVLFFHRDPLLITYNATLSEETARTIRIAVHDVVFEHLGQWQRPHPQALFMADTGEVGTAVFTSSSIDADSLEWHFGDGTDIVTSAMQATVTHQYADTGWFEVTLIASRHCMADTASTSVYITSDSTAEAIFEAAEHHIRLYPNPASDRLIIETPNGGVLTVYSIDGTMVWRQMIGSTHHLSLYIADWPVGEYIVWLEDSSGVFSRKIIVRH